MAKKSVKATKVRRVIAKKLTTSWTTVPRVAYTKILVCDELKSYREKLNAGREKADKVSFNTLIMYACVKALKKYPEINAQFEDDHIIYDDCINMGVAVDTPYGLMVPNVKSAQDMGLEEFSAAVNKQVEAARAGALQLDDMMEGTFTVSNMGMLGIDHATPIINYPESSILGAYSMQETPAVKDGEIVIQTQQELVLVSDHRLVDGALAAKFLCDVVYMLEHPETLA